MVTKPLPTTYIVVAVLCIPFMYVCKNVARTFIAGCRICSEHKFSIMSLLDETKLFDIEVTIDLNFV